MGRKSLSNGFRKTLGGKKFGVQMRQTGNVVNVDHLQYVPLMTATS